MTDHAIYFFCGIGGSGMLPLAQIMRGRGCKIYGSDRAYDQGRSEEKFASLKNMGFELKPQDGSGLEHGMTLVVSSAIEPSIPDVARAIELNIPIIKRAELLAQIFNQSKVRIAVGGTSGKSTVTAMIGYLLHTLGADPTVMNGAVMANFVSDMNPFASAVMGGDNFFVTEADESDGSIALYKPTIAVLNNIALDHKPMTELRALFQGFLGSADIKVVNIDNSEVKNLNFNLDHIVTVGIEDTSARYILRDNVLIDQVTEQSADFHVPLLGAHNRMNALIAIATIHQCGFLLSDIVAALNNFKGVKRRLEIVGSTKNITVIDDFAHNPDKISASLSALKEKKGRLLILFQMHGFAPLKLMFDELSDAFANGLSHEDKVFMPEVLYLGGTASRDVTAKDFVQRLNEKHVNAQWFESRSDIIPEIISSAREGDRIIIMGARDDTLSDIAKMILKELAEK